MLQLLTDSVVKKIQLCKIYSLSVIIKSNLDSEELVWNLSGRQGWFVEWT